MCTWPTLSRLFFLSCSQHLSGFYAVAHRLEQIWLTASALQPGSTIPPCGAEGTRRFVRFAQQIFKWEQSEAPPRKKNQKKKHLEDFNTCRTSEGSHVPLRYNWPMINPERPLLVYPSACSDGFSPSCARPVCGAGLLIWGMLLPSERSKWGLSEIKFHRSERAAGCGV